MVKTISNLTPTTIARYSLVPTLILQEGPDPFHVPTRVEKCVDRTLAARLSSASAVGGKAVRSTMVFAASMSINALAIFGVMA